jgi:serine/threonine protein phosphatase 1
LNNCLLLEHPSGMGSAVESGVNGQRLGKKFARLRNAQRVWAVAAINGAAQRLIRLHDAISDRFREGDRVVYLGNYIGYGEAVIATMDELLDFRRRVLGRQRGFACDVAFLRGAQEEMWHKLLQLQFASNPSEVLQWMVSAGMEATVRAYGGDLRQGLAATRDGPRTITRWTAALRNVMNSTPGHTTLFSALRHAAFTEELGVLFVHAAIDPSRPLAAQGDSFWWGRDDILELSASFEGFRRVVRGIDREQRSFTERDFAVSLNGGTGQFARLTAACFGVGGEVHEVIEA